jgi:hypothetical protein
MPSTIPKKSGAKKKITLGTDRRATLRAASLSPAERMERNLKTWGSNVLTEREQQIYRSLLVLKG